MLEHAELNALKINLFVYIYIYIYMYMFRTIVDCVIQICKYIFIY